MEYLEVVRRLKRHDPGFEVWLKRGKGSHRMIHHPGLGEAGRSHPVPFHGNKTVIRKGILNDLSRKFDLPDDFWE